MAQLLIIGKALERSTDLLVQVATNQGLSVKSAETFEEGARIHAQGDAEVTFLLLPVQDATASDVMKKLKRQDPRSIVIISGKDSTVSHGPSALELGAYLYLKDTADKEELLAALGLAMEARRTDAQLRYLRGRDAAGSDWQSIIGQSKGMRLAFAMVRKICRRTMLGGSPTVLITGETGTGKGLFAKALHYNGVRRSRAFVELNCAAVPPQLLEAELFGHEQGAFTDARATRIGLLETAHLGTLFLDEIGALPIELQAKLHLVVEEKSVRRLGSSRARPVDVQLVAATSKDLESMVEEGKFAADLYHRLNVVRIHLPPLRDRGEDKVMLAESFLESLCLEYGLPPKRLSDEARKAINDYYWPGNVRELKNRIERVILLVDDEVIQREHLGLHTKSGRVLVSMGQKGDVDVDIPRGGVPLATLERAAIMKALDLSDGNVSKAARLLDISRHTLLYRMKKHNISKSRIVEP
ncbi:MAG: sigma-54-dependent Fis family transcriptional regulator [Deltaproteobacteria bacterium]|nr:sigma-54-dependent Fis family transcriptional regulator [Deltaproteobacteria bacterium]